MPSIVSKLIGCYQIKYADFPIDVLKSSADSEVGRLLDVTGAEASASMDIDGKCKIMIKDDIAGRAAIYEELAHVLQFRRDGNIALGDSMERCMREIEVAECLLCEKKRRYLSEAEIKTTEANLEYYRNNLREVCI